MKKFILSLVSVLILLLPLAGYAKENKKTRGPNIGEGMEIRKIKGLNLLIPKDAVTWYEGDVLKVEDSTGYSASRFIEIDEQFKQINKAVVNLQAQIDELKRRLTVIKEAK